jgi:hypothetical protein
MLMRREELGACWWCHTPADSREHKMKKSDLLREFGRPFDEAPVRLREERLETIQGPGSDLVKFEANLCAPCNNTRSQPFDYAYDQFVTYVAAHQRHILASRRIDLRTIFGSDWQAGGENTLRYLVKHIGCRLAQNQVEVPSSLRAFLDGGDAPDHELAVEIEIRGDIAEMSRSGMGGGLGMGDLLVTDFDEDRQATVIESHLDYRWLRLAWGVGEELSGYPLPFGAPLLQLALGRSLPPGELRKQVRLNSATGRELGEHS